MRSSTVIAIEAHGIHGFLDVTPLDSARAPDLEPNPMQLESVDPALQAANLALAGRRIERTTTRLASVQLRSLGGPSPASSPMGRGSQHHVAWEAGAMLAVGVLALLLVVGVWFL